MNKLIIAAVFALFFIAPVHAQGLTKDTVQESVHYVELFPDVDKKNSDKIEIQEFFWYGCPHCYAFEPHLRAWLEKKPENVEFVSTPVVFNSLAAFHAQSYYALKQMNVMTPELHQAIFDEINEKRNYLKTADDFAEFLKKQSVDADTYLKVVNSFAVKTKVKRAADLAKRYGITGVPSIVIDGVYRTGSGIAGGGDGMLVVVDHLLEKIEQEKK